ncbi:MAG: hypothetical protein WCZ19_01790, partial [Acholeplasma sp.]
TFNLTLSDGTIDGNLTIIAPNLTLDNYTSVLGDIHIEAISDESFTGHTPMLAVHVYAPNSRIILNNTVEYLYIEANDAYIELTDTVEVLFVSEISASIEIVSASWILDANINSASTLLDSLPQNLSGLTLPMFKDPVLLEINYVAEQSFNHGLTVYEIMDLLPESVEVITTDGTLMIDVEVYTIHQANYDPENPDTQHVEAIGLLDLPENLINLHQLELIFSVTILSFRDSNIEITSFEPLDSIEIPFGEVSTVEEIISLLPDTVLAYASDDTSLSVDALWDLVVGTFDPSQTSEQVLNFEAVMNNIPEGYHNLGMIVPYIEVTILEHEIGLVEPSGQVHVQSNMPEGVVIDIQEQSAEGGLFVTITLDVDPDYTYKHMSLYSTGYVFTTNLTYTQYLGPTSQYHVVVTLEKIYRPDLTTAFASGDGSQYNPLVITTAEHLNNLRYFLDKSYYFVLGNDIYLDEQSYFEPMTSPSQSIPFSGVLDGQNFSIFNYRVHQDNEDVSNAFIDINHGVIRNIKFIDVDVTRTDNYRYDGNLVKENGHGALISNVTMTGFRSGGGAGLVGQNRGTIEGVTINMDLENSNAGLVVSNYNIIVDSIVHVTLLINQKHLGYIGGVVGSNFATENNPAVITNVAAEVYINYDITSDHTDDSTDIGGFVYLNRGHQSSTSQAMILDSTIYVEINTLNGHGINRIGGFVSDNSNLGLINHSTSTGYIHGGAYLGGFVGVNRDGINPGIITNSTAHVDVFGQGSRIGGFVGVNDGDTVSAPYKAKIEFSESFGDVYGNGTHIGSFAGEQSGILIETFGHGTVSMLED